MKTWVNTSDVVIPIGGEIFQPQQWYDEEDTFYVNDVRIVESYLYLTRLVHEIKESLPLTVDEKGDLNEESKSLLARQLIEKGIDRVAVAVSAKQQVDGKPDTVTAKYVRELVEKYR